MDELARQLAQAARDLDLSGQDPGEASPESLAELARVTLLELIARGLLPDPEPQVGCWARPRSPSH